MHTELYQENAMSRKFRNYISSIKFNSPTTLYLSILCRTLCRGIIKTLCLHGDNTLVGSYETNIAMSILYVQNLSQNIFIKSVNVGELNITSMCRKVRV